ncbi:MAG: flagellar hook-associated protein 3 FlgL [Myxococcota bacterium]|jgi:flagellar hook-associated protein 3 FlgL
MRISESMMYRRISTSLSGAQSKIAEATEPLMTGHRINRPSDDPIRAQRLARADRTMAKAEQFRGNVSRNMVYHQVVETTVTNVTDTLSEMSTLAIAMANDSLSAGDRASAAAQVDSMIEALESYGNAKFNGRFLFSGRIQDQPAYDASMAFVGDTVGRTVQVSEGLEVSADVTGPTVFGDQGSSAFEAAQALSDALKANDTAGIQTALGLINASHEQSTRALTEIGFTMVDMNRADSYQEDKAFTTELHRASLDEVDVAEAASAMSFAEGVYNTAIQVASRINRLVDSLSRL